MMKQSLEAVELNPHAAEKSWAMTKPVQSVQSAISVVHGWLLPAPAEPAHISKVAKSLATRNRFSFELTRIVMRLLKMNT